MVLQKLNALDGLLKRRERVASASMAEQGQAVVQRRADEDRDLTSTMDAWFASRLASNSRDSRKPPVSPVGHDDVGPEGRAEDLPSLPNTEPSMAISPPSDIRSRRCDRSRPIKGPCCHRASWRSLPRTPPPSNAELRKGPRDRAPADLAQRPSIGPRASAQRRSRLVPADVGRLGHHRSRRALAPTEARRLSEIRGCASFTNFVENHPAQER